MSAISLFPTFGKSSVDKSLMNMVRLYEMSFPNRIRGYYLLGSYADGRAVVGSDLDTYILFKEAFLSLDEAERAQQLTFISAQTSALRLEIKLGDEQSLQDEQCIIRFALINPHEFSLSQNLFIRYSL
jgi:predicted nucleotidyltransferase